MKYLAMLLSLLVLMLTMVPMGHAADEARIRKNVDDMVEAINNGKSPEEYAADSFEPYVFIMTADGLLLVHPYLQGEYLPEKAGPIYQALQQADTKGLWVDYLWKGTTKHTYVRRTANNLTIGSGN